jgi:RHS repeat-associated protein
MTTRNEKSITYDYDNRATSITGESSTVTNIYDYSGQRIKKTVGSSTTIYIGKLYECNNGVCTKHIFAGSQRVASKKIGVTDTDTSVSTDTVYYHTDHLGSSTVITKQDGTIAQETYYYPFGETRYNSGDATHYKYTGQEEDPETGLYYYGARYYDPIIGRFISADTIVPNFANPQSLNRYSYVENNPLRYIDPTGHFKFSTFLKAFAAGFVGGAVFVLSGGTAAFAAGAIGKLMLAGMAAGAAAGATSAALNGGDLGQILTSAAIGGALGGAGALASFAVGPAAVLAAGAGYSAAKGGLDGLLYFAGGLAGGIAGAYSAQSALSSAQNDVLKQQQGDIVVGTEEQPNYVLRVKDEPTTLDKLQDFMSVGYKAANILKGIRQTSSLYNDIVKAAYKIECGLCEPFDVIVHQYSLNPPTYNYMGLVSGGAYVDNVPPYIRFSIGIIGHKGCQFRTYDENLYWRQGTAF